VFDGRYIAVGLEEVRFDTGQSFNAKVSYRNNDRNVYVCSHNIQLSTGRQRTICLKTGKTTNRG